MKKRGYWKSWENTKLELERLIEELGHFPSSILLDELKEFSLLSSLHRYHGGLYSVREKMGYPQAKKQNKYWKNRENVEKEIKEIVEEYGYFPSFSKLRESKHRGIINALAAHGGIVKFRKLIKSRKPRHYWENIENISKELKKITKSLGHFPSSYELSKLEYKNLATAIYQHHGGIDKVRERMGYEKFIIKPNGYWKDINNVINELKEITMKLGHFPTKTELLEIGESSLDVSISKYHGGFDNVKFSMGYGTIRKKDQFISFLSRNQKARNLVSITINANGFRSDIEQIINEVYTGKFKDQETLHNLIDESTDQIYELIQHGMINLGYFIGGFTLQDRKIIPVLIGEAIDNIPEKRINASLEYRLVRLLRQSYSPEFNEDPKRVIEELKVKTQDSKGRKRKLYERLSRHYTEVLELKEELT